MIIEKTLSVQKTARYYILGNPSKKIKTVWFVLHGYGHLAKDFINDFQSIANNENLIVAPEGLSKLYFRGLSGNIGASWMTKEDRENEITDYVNYLNTVYNKITHELNGDNIEFNVLGFSQGCHTAIRWLDRSKINVSKLILWSGFFPDDIDFSLNNKYWSSIDCKVSIGDKDRLIDKPRLNAQIEKLNSQKFNVELVNFEGGHKIVYDLLSKLCNPINLIN